MKVLIFAILLGLSQVVAASPHDHTFSGGGVTINLNYEALDILLGKDRGMGLMQVSPTETFVIIRAPSEMNVKTILKGIHEKAVRELPTNFVIDDDMLGERVLHVYFHYELSDSTGDTRSFVDNVYIIIAQ